ncbi:MAG TPA: hypothetical protein VIK56_07100 [Rhodoferax sp.]
MNLGISKKKRQNGQAPLWAGAVRWKRENIQKQDVGANIWCAVLAVRWPVVIVVIGWLDPEVLLSLLRKIKNRIVPKISWQMTSGFCAVLRYRERVHRFYLAVWGLQSSPIFKQNQPLARVYHA